MHYLKGIKKTISLIALTAFILVNSVYAAPNHNSLRPILKSTISDDTSYRVFRAGVNDYIDTHPVDPYAPLRGTPSLRRKTAELINREVLRFSRLRISSDDVTVSLGTTGLLELLSRIFCNIEGAALKSEEERDLIALSERAKPLYSQKSVFGRAGGLEAENPKMIVIDSLDIEADKLEGLLTQASEKGIIVVFLDNDSSHRNISQVYELLDRKEAYRVNTVIITDISRRFGLAEYNVGAFVAFNKAIISAYNAAAGGSIAAVSQNTQAGFQRLIESQPGPAAETQEAGEIRTVDNPEVINLTFRHMEPDPTLSINPVGMLDKHGLPQIFRDPDSAFQKTLQEVVPNIGNIPISEYEKAFAKAQNLGIVAELEKADRSYAELLLTQYPNDRETFLQRLLDEPNSEIVEILQGVLKHGQLDASEIMALWVVFNVKKMHVGAPGFARDPTGMEALRLPEKRLTLKEIEEELLDAGVFFAKDVFGLAFVRENVASGFYGSKPVGQDVLTALQLINGREVAVAVPKPYYVGYKSSILGAGIPLKNIAFFNTRTSENWVPTPDEAKEAFDKLSPDAQKVLLLTTPDNPSGTAVPQDAIEKLLEFAVRNDAFIIFDVAYARLLFEEKLPANLGEICRNIFNRLESEKGFKQRKGINDAGDLTKYFLIMQTQSKELLHPGSRLGVAISGDTVLIQKLREIKILDADPVAKKAQAIIYGASHADYAKKYIQEHNAYLERNVNHICAVLKGLGIHYIKPEGAFYILFRIGEGPYIRFSFAGPFADIIQVMARIERLYPQWKAEEKYVNFTSDDLFKEAAITSVSGNAFGAPENKEEEAAIEARHRTGEAI